MEQMRLSFIPVVTDQQFRDLLLVRNECRDGLTHDTHELTLEDQKGFRAKCWGENLWYEPYLLYDEDWPIGYGLLKWDGQRYWMTAGLVWGYRGKGLSRLLISFITEMGHREGKEIWIDVLDDNPALYGDIRVGYEFVEENANKHDTQLHVMKHNRERRLSGKELFWMANHGKIAKNDQEGVEILKEMEEVADISNKFYGPVNS